MNDSVNKLTHLRDVMYRSARKQEDVAKDMNTTEAKRASVASEVQKVDDAIKRMAEKRAALADELQKLDSKRITLTDELHKAMELDTDMPKYKELEKLHISDTRNAQREKATRECRMYGRDDELLALILDLKGPFATGVLSSIKPAAQEATAMLGRETQVSTTHLRETLLLAGWTYLGQIKPHNLPGKYVYHAPEASGLPRDLIYTIAN